MNHLINTEARPYRSRLRTEQAQGTRDRILEATVRVIAGGIASVSIPAVAQEAGVSIATIYRNFPTKRALLEAVYPYTLRRANRSELKPPTSMADFHDGLRTLFDRVDSMGDLERAAIASAGADEVRHATMPYRLEITRHMVDAIAPNLQPRERERVVRLVVVLTASASLRMWRDHLDVPVEEAIDDIEWTIRAVVAASRPAAAT